MRVWGLEGLRHRVWDLGFRDSGFRDLGLGN